MGSDNIVISARDLTKVYKLYDRPVDRLKESLHLLNKIYHNDFFALKNVSFDIKAGETVGIIGKNGAGKSTLLKILTGVLTPTDGKIMTKGKVSALLELGAGFNSELTGIENVYLNGTIMGYKKEEIDLKIDSILSFADIGDFINQPVKMYSSGMFARLAFAVAINVEPDILIIDEALSVGDFVFQHKCYMKFKELQDKGATVLFVSHSSQHIINYCNRAILLHEGEIYDDSYDVEKAIYKYEEMTRLSTTYNEGNDARYVEMPFSLDVNQEVNEQRFGSHDAVINEVYLTDDENSWKDGETLKAGSIVYLKLVVISKRDIESAVIGASIKDVHGNIVWGDNTIEAGKQLRLRKGRNIITFKFALNVVPGEYLLYLGLADIGKNERVELDQRWPVKKINIVNIRRMAEGMVFAPSRVIID